MSIGGGTMKKALYWMGITIISIQLLAMEKVENTDETAKIQDEIEQRHYLYLFMEYTDNEDAVIDLFEAVLRNRQQTLRKMLAAGRHNINSQDELGWTPLILAIYLERSEIISLLLDDDHIDIHVLDQSGKNAYDWAIKKFCPTIATLLLMKEMEQKK
jgi:hypothetical protein